VAKDTALLVDLRVPKAVRAGLQRILKGRGTILPER
jgi:hypothetical protein